MADGHDLLGAIRNHYDQLSFFYRLFWGDHIHHGYWEDDEAPAAAQENLIARLAERAAVPRGGHVLDVGCGLGGSSFWLARHLGCSVQGITISPAQCAMAATRAREEGLSERVSFAVVDANRLELPAESFDAVWVIECSEHLADKADFLRRAARVLRPGGRLVLLDHVASDRRWVLALERLLEPLFMRMDGDHLTRRPLPLVQAAGFSVTWSQRSKAGIIERLIAVRPSSGA